MRIVGAHYTFGVVPTVESLLRPSLNAERVFIDIPIGLRDRDGIARQCDTAARKLLGPSRRSSVFPAPIRAILQANSFDDARAQSRALTGKSPSKQTFFIMPKIHEVDSLMRTNSRARLVMREAHPELCFCGLAGGQAMTHKKSTLAGFQERLDVLRRFFPAADSLVESALSSYLRKEVAKDDILDALVCAVVATMSQQWVTVPATPELDSHGIPMEMVYAEVN